MAQLSDPLAPLLSCDLSTEARKSPPPADTPVTHRHSCSRALRSIGPLPGPAPTLESKGRTSENQRVDKNETLLHIIKLWKAITNKLNDPGRRGRDPERSPCLDAHSLQQTSIPFCALSPSSNPSFASATPLLHSSPPLQAEKHASNQPGFRTRTDCQASPRNLHYHAYMVRRPLDADLTVCGWAGGRLVVGIFYVLASIFCHTSSQNIFDLRRQHLRQ